MSFQSRFRGVGGKRTAGQRLLPALAASLALHALLLWPDVLPSAARQAAQPLTATLRAVRNEAPPAPRPAPAAVPRLATGGASRQPLARAEESPIPVTRHAEGAAGQAAAPKGTAQAQPGEAAAPDAEGIRAYRIVLAREARAHRQYPPLARERGWTGTAEVSVDVSREGRARHILLARSSGHEVLDREAVSMMSRAAAAAALPDSLRGREFAVRLPVVFDIAEIQ